MTQSASVPNQHNVKIFGEQTTGTETAALIDASGHLQVDVMSITGGATDDAAAPTTPAIVAGLYTAAPATRHTGDAVTLQCTATGYLLTADSDKATDDAAAPTVGPLVMGKFGASSPDANDAAPIRCGSSGEVVIADLNTATDDAAAPTTGPLVMGKFGASTPDANDAAPLQCDSSGTLMVAQAVAAAFNCTEASGAGIAASAAIMDDWDGSSGAAAGTDGCMQIGLAAAAAPAAVDAADAVRVLCDRQGRVSTTGNHLFHQSNADSQTSAVACILHRVIISTTAAGVLTIYNNAAEAAPAVAVFTFAGAAVPQSIDLGGVYLGTGCYVGKDGAWAGDVTVVYDVA